jgi:hypothetical protein
MKARLLLLSLSAVLALSQPALAADSGTALRAKAEKGNTSAQYQLGIDYQEGLNGFPKDPDQATEWFTRVAKTWAGNAINGDPQGEYGMGLLYTHGYGVTQDDAKAFALFQKAANQGLSEAQLSVGIAYTAGKGVTRDIEQAYFWLTLASKDTKNIKGKAKTDELREDAAKQLDPRLRAAADKRVAEWKPGAEAAPAPAAQSPSTPPPAAPTPATSAPATPAPAAQPPAAPVPAPAAPK